MATLYVGTSDGDYLTIDAAVKAAAAGDTIVVQGSEYTTADERVTINKSLTLKAEGDVTMRGLNIGGKDFDLVVDGINFVAAEVDASGATGYSNNASCISQTGQLRNVTIENCTFDLTEAGMTRTYGIFLSLGTWGFENLVVRNNVCNGYYDEEAYSGYGLIYAANVQDADISNNVITYAASHAIQLSLTGTTYQGSGEQTVQINGNIIEKSYACAVYCADLHNSDMTVAIKDNMVKDVQEGSCSIYHGALRIGQSTISGVEITGNLIEGAQVGIYNAAAIKEGSNGKINISNNAIAVSQIHAAEEGVTPEFSGFGGTVIPEGTADANMVVEGSVIAADTSLAALYVNGSWSSLAEGTKVVAGGKVVEVGTNAFASFVDVLGMVNEDTTAVVVAGDVTEDIPAEYKEIILAQALEIKGEGTVTLNNGGYKALVFAGADVKVSGIELVAPKTQLFFGISATADDAAVTTNVEVAADALVSAYVIKIAEDSTVNVLEGGKFFTTGEVMRVEGTLNASGDAAFDAASATLTADDRQTVAHYSWIYGTENLKDNYNTIYSQLRLIGADSEMTLDNARLEVGKTVAGEWLGNPVANGVGWIKLDGAMTLDNGSVLLASGATGKDGFGLTLSKGAEFTVANGSEAELSAGISNMGTVNVDGGTLVAGSNFAGAGTQAPNYDIANAGDINVTDVGVFSANNVSNVTMVTLSGLAKGAARTIQVSFIPAAGGAGAVMNVDVAANATSVTIPANSLADGSYTVTYVDGGQAFMLSGLVEAYNGRINVNGGIFTADSVSVGKGTFDIDGASSVNVAALDGVANVKGGTLTDSVIGGVVAVTGDTAFEGTNEFSKIWVSGGTLTVNGDLVTKTPYPAFFVIGNDESVNAAEKAFYNGFIGTEAGEMIVNGSYTAEEGVVGNGGKLTVNGEMTANCLYLRGGETTVAEGGSLTGIVWGGVDAGASLIVDGGTFATKLADGMGSFSNAGTFTVAGDSSLQIVNFASGTIEVADGTSLTDTVIAGKGTVKLNGTVNFYGANSIAAVENTVFDIVVNKNASLVIARANNVWGYGRDVAVYGVIEDATALESLDGVTLSLKADSSSGFSVGGTGTHTLTVEDAYIDLASTSWKNAKGTYTWDFTNSYVKAASFLNCNAAGSDSASWEITFDDSVLAASSHFKSGKGVEINFTNGSVANVSGSMRMDGVLNIDATSSVTVNGYFNAGAAGAASEHSDILGTLNIAGAMNIKGNGTVELLGGSVNVKDGGALNLVNDNGSRLDVLVDADSAVTVSGGSFTAGKVTNNGSFIVAAGGESTLDITTLAGSSIELADGAIVKDSTVGGKVYVDGAVTFRGKNVFTMITDYGTYYTPDAPAKWTVEKGASVELTSGSYGLGYGDNVTVLGEITDAKAAFAAGLTKADASLIVNNTFITQNNSAGRGTSNSLTVNGAYVRISMEGADNSFKNHASDTYGSYLFTFTDAVFETNSFKFTSSAEGTDGKYDFVMTNSVFKTGGEFIYTDVESTMTVINSDIISTGMNGIHENAGTLILQEGATFSNVNSVFTNSGTLTLTADSRFTAQDLINTGSITINAAGFTEGLNKVIDLSGTTSLQGKVTVENLEDGTAVYYLADGDVILSNADISTIFVSTDWAGKEFGDTVGEGMYFGINAFAAMDDAVALLSDNNGTIALLSDAEMNVTPEFKLNVVSGDGSTYTLKVNAGINYVDAEFAKEINIDSALFAAYYGDKDVVVNGNLKGGIYKHTGTMTFNNSKITDSYDNSNINGGAVVTINGDGSWTLDNAQADNLKFISIGRDNWMGQGILNLNDTVVKAIAFDINSNSADAISQINAVNSTIATVLNDGLFGNISVSAYGEINLTDSDMYVVGTLTNNGAVNVTGEGYIKANVSGNGITLNNATLTADSNVGGSAATKVYGTSEIKGTVGTVYANWTGSKENGLYAGYTTEDVALTLDGATTGNVYVGSDTEGYGAEPTVKGGSKVGGIYDRVYGSTVITGSDNVVDYISAKGSITIENAENTEIKAMVAEGADIIVTDSEVKFAIGTNNNIQLDEGTQMTISGSEVAIQQMTIDATSSLVLTNSTVTVDDVYDEVNLITNNGSITIDALSTLTADSIANNGTITIDAAGFTEARVKVIDLNQSAALSGVKLTNGTGYYLEYAADGDVSIVKSPDTVYVSSDYNSSTEGWGYTHFANYDSAVAYIKNNAKKATMVIEKTTTVSGNCFQDKTESLGVDLTNAVIVKDGAVVGNAQSKWDMTYSVTLEGGAIFQSARGTASGIGNTHIKNVLTIGDGSEKRAEVRFVNGLSGITYQTMSIALLGALNRKLVTNNALVEVGDLGINGTASFTDTTFTVVGIFAIKGSSIYKTTMTDSTMTVKGHNLMNENNYYSTVGTILSTLTMDNSSITVDDGAEDTAAEKVWLGYTGNTAQTLTMTNGSSITVEKGTEVQVANTVTVADSTISVGTLNAGVTKAANSSFYFNGLEKGTVYYAVLYDAEGNELETIVRTSLNASTFYPKFALLPAGDYTAKCFKDEAKTELVQEKTYSFTAVGTLTLTNSELNADKLILAGNNLTMDYDSTVAFGAVEGGYITVSNAADYVDNADVVDGSYKLLDYTGDAAMTEADYKVLLNDAWHDNYMVFNNDLYLTDQDTDIVHVSAEWKDAEKGSINADGSIIGFNAAGNVKDLANMINTDGRDTTVKFHTDMEVADTVNFAYGTGDILFTADQAVTIAQTAVKDFRFTLAEDMTVTVGENVTFQIYDNASGWYQYYGPSLELYGTITGGQNWGCTYLFNGEHTVHSTGTLSTGRIQLGFTTLNVEGDAESERTAAHIDTNYLLVEGSTFNAENAIVEAGIIHDSNNGGMRWGASEFNFSNSQVTAGNMTIQYADSVVEVNNSVFDVTGTLSNAGTFNVTGTSTIKIGASSGNAIEVLGGGLKDSDISGIGVRVSGDAEFSGDNKFTGNIKVTNGAELVIGENASVTGEDTFLYVGNNDESLYSSGMANGDTVGGKLRIDGSVEVSLLTANAGGEIIVNGSVVTDELFAGHGALPGETVGVIEVAGDGYVETGKLYVKDESTVNVNGDLIADDIIVNTAGNLNIDGGYLNADNASIDANSSVNVTGNSDFTVSGTLGVAGTLTVDGAKFVANEVNLYTLLTFDITAGEARTISVSFISVDAFEGVTVKLQAEANATSVSYKGTEIADGKYYVTVFDGETSVRSEIDVVGGSFDVKGESTLRIAALNGFAALRDGAVLSSSKVGGLVKVFGEAALEGDNGITSLNVGKGYDGAESLTVAGTATFGTVEVGNAALNITEGTVVTANTNTFAAGSTVSIDNADYNARSVTVAGALELTNGALLRAEDSFSIAASGSVTIDTASVISFAGAFVNAGVITVDMDGFANTIYRVIDYTGTGSMDLADYGELNAAEGFTFTVKDNDLYVITENFDFDDAKINSNWSGAEDAEALETGRVFGINGFASIDDIADAEGKISGLTKLTISNTEYAEDLTFTDEALPIVLENTELSGEVTVTGAHITLDAESSINAISAAKGVHLSGAGSVGSVTGSGLFDAKEGITVGNATSFNLAYLSDITVTGAFTMTDGSDELYVNGDITVGTVDFLQGSADKMVVAAGATVDAGVIESSGKLTIAMAYAGETALSVTGNGAFATNSDLVINLTAFAADADGVSLLVSGIDAFAGSVVLDGGSVSLNESVIFNNNRFVLSITGEGLALVEAAEVRNDLDNNGLSDILLWNADNSNCKALLTTGSDPAFKELVLGDFDRLIGAGKVTGADVEGPAVFYQDDNTVKACIMGDGNVAEYRDIWQVADNGAEVIGLGDFNGDGATDLLVAVPQSDDGVAVGFISNGEWNYFQSLGSEWEVTHVGDFNNDGRDDVMLENAEGFAGAWLIKEDGTPEWAGLDSISSVETCGVGDFNGDGIDDVLVRNGEWVGAWIVGTDGDASNGLVDSFIGIKGDLAVENTIEQIGDFNGDGVDDIVIRTAAGDLGVLSINGDSTDWKYFTTVSEEWKSSIASL